jgi:hypothetical protein
MNKFDLCFLCYNDPYEQLPDTDYRALIAVCGARIRGEYQMGEAYGQSVIWRGRKPSPYFN